jgi:quinol monooxygenase YgiN
MGPVSAVARYGKAVARPGQGDELAGILLAAAEDLDGNPGCELYLVSRQKGEPDTIYRPMTAGTRPLATASTRHW